MLLLRYIMREQGQGEAAGQGQPDPPMHLAVVTCGDRLEETLTMVKSAVLFSIRHLHLHIFTEDQLHASFMEAVSLKYFFCHCVLTTSCSVIRNLQCFLCSQLESWPVMIRSKFSYTVYSISFPKDNAAEWKKLFKPCASQRLFLPVC